jgi:hypothetical protein
MTIQDKLIALQNINKSKDNQKIAFEYYRNKPINFINDWVITFDPRLKENKFIPFILFPRQIDFINWIEDRYDNNESGICEKSRDSGMSWLAMAWSIHKWLYEDGFAAGFGSRKADFVDKLGNPSSLFEKGRMIIRYLPSFFLFDGFREDTHLSYMRFINPSNGATITGESGDNIGRGGRTSIYFKDESAFYERPELIEASLTANTEVQIDISTPNGAGNPFHQKSIAGIIPKFTYHWIDDPRKNKDWKDKKLREVGEVIFAQEYDIDYDASLPNIVIPNKFIRDCVNIDVDDSGAIIAGLDVADDGEDKNSICIKKGNKVLFIDEWSGLDVGQTTLKAIQYCIEYKAEILNYDSIGVGAGVKATVNLVKPQNLECIAVSVAESPTDGKYGDKTNKDTFLNLRAELWWKMRDRIKKQEISLPNDCDLISELSKPLYFFNEKGKIQIESKKDMRKRGIKSPNKADSLLLAFCSTYKKIDWSKFIN